MGSGGANLDADEGGEVGDEGEVGGLRRGLALLEGYASMRLRGAGRGCAGREAR